MFILNKTLWRRTSKHNKIFFFFHKWARPKKQKKIIIITEAVVRKCSVKKVFLEISQNSQENSCAKVPERQRTKVCNFSIKETLTQKFSCEFCKISKNIVFHRPPPVVASIINYLIIVLIKMRLLLFLVFSQYELACKHGIIFHISI